MRVFGLSLPAQLSGVALLVVRVIVGIIMTAHGWQKLTEIGPANFGQGLAQSGVPLPIFMGYVVTFTEFIGGILLIVGLLSRLAALFLTINLTVAILLVSIHSGLLSSTSRIGMELPLALIAGFLAILLAGPGRLSLDYLLGVETDAAEGRES
ncbi:MAG: DoxX family protein [Rubrobacter sp.]|nr:DoxX family protein [Rubrobacter sp.]